jgi:nucleotide-binding universal stress UspA family protein
LPTTIAVGVDGSEPSLIALRWALAAAVVRDAEVLVVIAEPPRPERAREPARATRLRNAEIADQITATRRAIRETVRSENGDIAPSTETPVAATVHIEQRQGSPTEVLLAVSGRVDLLVVGGHGYSGWRDHFTPSVSGQLAIRTKAAVCVVRAIVRPERHRIVVGYDARSGPAAAEFAITEAAARGASTLIVSTWQYPRDTRATSSEAAEILEQGAAAALGEFATELRRAHPGTTIDTVVRFGYPVDVLAELAESTDMLVIGSQQHSGLFGNGIRTGGLLAGGLATLVVGSVAIGILRRVPTPVVIVPSAG